MYTNDELTCDRVYRAYSLLQKNSDWKVIKELLIQERDNELSQLLLTNDMLDNTMTLEHVTKARAIDYALETIDVIGERARRAMTTTQNEGV